jgi:phenylacetate-CoA ligase
VATHLRDFFGTRVLDMYASEEFNLIAWQCLTTGEYHVCDETVALEVIDDDLRSVRSGETGEMIGTALHSFAAPIIRYRSGDLVKSGATQCACGVPLSSISEIQGRVIHYLKFPDGRIIHHNKVEQAVAYAAGWVRQVQVSQPRADHVIVRVAPLMDASEEEIDLVRSSVKEVLYNLMSVEIVLDRDLGPDRRGKLLPMITLPVA